MNYTNHEMCPVGVAAASYDGYDYHVPVGLFTTKATKVRKLLQDNGSVVPLGDTVSTLNGQLWAMF
jgi:hypothetical protein